MASRDGNAWVSADTIIFRDMKIKINHNPWPLALLLAIVLTRFYSLDYSHSIVDSNSRISIVIL